jgi:Pseudouridine synthase II TruB, C-terminal
LRQGQIIDIPRESPESSPGTAPGKVRIYAAGLGFLGLGQVETDGRLVPLRLIAN